MDKQHYLEELRTRLKGLPQEEVDDAIHYCEEYFLDAGSDAEEQVIQELGSPFRFAAQIKAECEIHRQHDIKQKSPVISSIKTILYITLGICTLPVAIPFISVLFVLLFASMIVLASFFMVGVVASIFMLGFGLILFVKGFFIGHFTYEICMLLGGGIFMIGFACLWFLLIYWFIQKILPAIIRILTKQYDRLKEKAKHEKAFVDF